MPTGMLWRMLGLRESAATKDQQEKKVNKKIPGRCQQHVK
jgi:hypothetical protein